MIFLVLAVAREHPHVNSELRHRVTSFARFLPWNVRGLHCHQARCPKPVQQLQPAP